SVKQIGNNGIFGNILGDIFLGVVSPHLLLVDVLLENVAQHIGVDFPVVAQWARVEVPVVLIKEGKEPLECFIGNVDTAVLLLQRMKLEQATIEVRYLPQQLFQVGSTLGWLLRKALVEQPQQKIAIEGEEFSLAMALLDHPEAILEIVCVTVEKTLALDEVDEHQSVE